MLCLVTSGHRKRHLEAVYLGVVNEQRRRRQVYRLLAVEVPAAPETGCGSKQLPAIERRASDYAIVQ